MEHLGQSQPFSANPLPPDNASLDRQWAMAAMEKELEALEALPQENINKPGSAFSVHLLKIASVVKGSGSASISPEMALNKIKFALRAYPNLKTKEVERQWKRAITTATPRHRQPRANGAHHPLATNTAAAAAQNVAKPPAPEINTKYPKTQDYLKAFEILDCQFRLNEMDNTIEMNEQPLDDVQADVLRNRMRDIGLDKVGWVDRAISYAAAQNTYHPIKEWLATIEAEWDGKDHIGHFVEHFLEESTGFAPVAFRRWLIGAVAKVQEQGQNFMMVWDGPQGVGKSALARWLCPLPDFFVEGAIRPDDKDSLVRAIKHLVWEVGELQATTRRADKEALKDFVSKRIVTVRRPYSVYDLVKPATASFIGTINEDGAGFLTDPTGNRRFVIINLRKIRWDYTEHVQPVNLWAQAAALYRKGESWQLSAAEQARQAAINEAYQMDSPVSVYFNEHFRVDPGSDKYETVAAIMDTLELSGLKGNQRENLHQLARLMKQLGAEQTRPKEGSKRPRSYRGVIRLSDERKEKKLDL